MQHPSEPLRGNIKRFTATYTDIKDLNESFSIKAFKAGVASEHVHYALFNGEITSMHKLVTKA